jgi:hypothetical protein
MTNPSLFYHRFTESITCGSGSVSIINVREQSANGPKSSHVFLESFARGGAMAHLDVSRF